MRVVDSRPRATPSGSPRARSVVAPFGDQRHRTMVPHAGETRHDRAEPFRRHPHRRKRVRSWASKPADMRVNAGWNCSSTGRTIAVHELVVGVRGTGFERDVHGVALARARAGFMRVEGELVARHVEHARIVVEHPLRPVAVVHVDVHDRDVRCLLPEPRRRLPRRCCRGRSPLPDHAPHGGPAAAPAHTRSRRASARARRPAPPRQRPAPRFPPIRATYTYRRRG